MVNNVNQMPIFNSQTHNDVKIVSSNILLVNNVLDINKVKLNNNSL